MTTFKTGDTGTATTPTPRPNVFAGGQPAEVAGQDYAVATTTAARPDVRNLDPSVGTGAPSATPHPGAV